MANNSTPPTPNFVNSRLVPPSFDGLSQGDNTELMNFSSYAGLIDSSSDNRSSGSSIESESEVDDNIDYDNEKQDDGREKNVSGNEPTTLNLNFVELAFESMKKECAALQLELDNERAVNIHLKPRYDYLEKHFKDYVRKREEYRRLIDKIEAKPKGDTTNPQLAALQRVCLSKETQTWKGIICSYCSKTFDIVHNKTFRDFVDWQTKNTFCVSRKTFEELQERFREVVAAIKEREVVYENRTERTQIISLKTESAVLKTQISQLMRKNKHGQHCLETLQRIIIKLVSDGNDPWIGKITEQEQLWIDRIVSKSPQLMALAENKAVSTTPSAIDFSRPHRARSCNLTNVDNKAAAGDF